MPFTGVQRLPVVNLNQFQSEQSDKQMKLLLVSPDACWSVMSQTVCGFLQPEVTWRVQTLYLKFRDKVKGEDDTLLKPSHEPDFSDIQNMSRMRRLFVSDVVSPVLSYF